MPLNKFAKKKTTTKRAYKKKSSAPTGSFARKVNAVLSKKAETKSHIVTLTESGVSSLLSPTSGQVVALNFLGVGSTNSTRAGNKISPTFLNVRGAVHLEPTSVTQYVRCMIVSCDVADDGINQLIESDSAVFAPPGGDLSAIFGRLNTTRYKVLAHKVLKLGHVNGFYSTQMFNFNVKLSGNMYFEQGENIPSKRKLLFIFYNRRADNDDGLGTTMEMTMNSKFYYHDI